MRLRACIVRIGLATMALMALLLPSAAQEPAPPRAADVPAVRKAAEGTRRVPPHFAKLGLTIEQREQIYRIRAQHQEQIEALRRQLDEQKVKAMAECEAVLTDAQRKLLQEQRQGKAKEKVAAAARPDAE